MISIQSYGSSSAGNAYLLSYGERSLLLEAGINLKKLQDIDFANCDGCLITHEHGDHSKFAMDILNKTGMDIYTSAGTQEALKLPKHRFHRIKALEQIEIGVWTVLPFDTQHDVNEPLGFFIQTKSDERVLFATDTYYIKYKLPGVTHLMIECNYAKDIIDAKVEAGKVLPFLRNRIIKSHFELENVKGFIKANDMSRLQEVWLLHLSDSNSDAERFKREIQELTGVPVYIAGE